MSATTMSTRGRSAGATLSSTDCEAILRSRCFGHLALAREGNIDVLPIRYACVDNWVYFRATPELREVIARHPWGVLSLTDWSDPTRVRSVIVRGGCYATEDTGSAADDTTSMRGIVALRDRADVGRSRNARVERTTTVFRLHAGEVSGQMILVPCPAGEREYDEDELLRLRASARTQSLSEDERADDDGMAEPGSPR